MSGLNSTYDRYEILYGTIYFFLIFGIVYPMIFNIEFKPYYSLMLAIGYMLFMLMSKGIGSFLSNTQMSTSNQIAQCKYHCSSQCCSNNDCKNNDVDKECYDKCHTNCKENYDFNMN